MEKLQINPTIVRDIQTVQTCKRLIVLLPNKQQIDEHALGRHIRKLAQIRLSSILFLSLINTYDDHIPTLTRLESIASISRDLLIEANVEVYFGNSWLKAVRSVWQPGDLVVCLAGHTIRTWMYQYKPVDELLVNLLGVSVYVVPA